MYPYPLCLFLECTRKIGQHTGLVNFWSLVLCNMLTSFTVQEVSQTDDDSIFAATAAVCVERCTARLNFVTIGCRVTRPWLYVARGFTSRVIFPAIVHHKNISCVVRWMVVYGYRKSRYKSKWYTTVNWVYSTLWIVVLSFWGANSF